MPTRAYPRSRGATSMVEIEGRAPSGLSPLTRGNRGVWCRRAAGPGPIPAHAGQPAGTTSPATSARAYPRSRGATAQSATLSGRCPGLSPLTRGNHTRRGTGIRVFGPIPAHAGQPEKEGPHQRARGAYPRSLGATDPAVQDGRPESGLSPLTRGNPAAAAADAGQDGPIPAHAGQPFGRGLPAWRQGAYPRSRGATLNIFVGGAEGWGLSPLTRGNRAASRRRRAGRGPIPAHAGQPAGHPGRASHAGAYPRSRGATGPAPAAVKFQVGLSPLTRGNRFLGHERLDRAGPIPAHAGQPHAAPGARQAGWAYPRSRGATSRTP